MVSVSAVMVPPFCNSLAVISACLAAAMVPSWLIILSLAISVISVPLVRLPPVLMMEDSLSITMPSLAVILPLLLSKRVNCQLISSKAILLSVLTRVLVFKVAASIDACLVLLVLSALIPISPVAVMSAWSPVLWILLVAMIWPRAFGMGLVWVFAPGSLKAGGCGLLAVLSVGSLLILPALWSLLGVEGAGMLVCPYRLWPITALSVLISVSVVMSSLPVPVWISWPVLSSLSVSTCKTPP